MSLFLSSSSQVDILFRKTWNQKFFVKFYFNWHYLQLDTVEKMATGWLALFIAFSKLTPYNGNTGLCQILPGNSVTLTIEILFLKNLALLLYNILVSHLTLVNQSFFYHFVSKQYWFMVNVLRKISICTLLIIRCLLLSDKFETLAHT